MTAPPWSFTVIAKSLSSRLFRFQVSPARLICVLGTVLAAVTVARRQTPAPTATPLVITQDTVLDPAKTYGPLVIKASNITIDGRGAWVIGATQGNPKDFKGNGVEADGVSGVTLKNLNAKGWDSGLKVQHGSKWLVEKCNFSDNFHYPEAGWASSATTAASSSSMSIMPRSARTRPTASGTPACCTTRTTTGGRERLFPHLEHLLEPFTACRNGS